MVKEVDLLRDSWEVCEQYFAKQDRTLYHEFQQMKGLLHISQIEYLEAGEFQSPHLVTDLYADDTMYQYRKSIRVDLSFMNHQEEYMFIAYYSPDLGAWVPEDGSFYHKQEDCHICRYWVHAHDLYKKKGHCCLMKPFDLKYLLDQVKEHPKARLLFIL